MTGNNVIMYKQFVGSISYSQEDRVFHGRIEGIPDLVQFEGKGIEELEAAFREAVDDYLTLCKEAGKQPFKSYKGSFNVRVTPDLHLRAAQCAALSRVSLNQFVSAAIDQAVAKCNLPKGVNELISSTGRVRRDKAPERTGKAPGARQRLGSSSKQNGR
jgi:predicted HicB family RNase H-like nuclease